MCIKVLASSVLLSLVLYSTSFNQIDTLESTKQLDLSIWRESGRVKHEITFKRCLQMQSRDIPFFLVLVFILNNKTMVDLDFV